MLRQRRRTSRRLSVLAAGLLLAGASVAPTPARAQDAAPPDLAASPWYDLGTLGGSGAEPTALNNRGAVVGISDTAGGSTHGFLWQDGAMTDLSPGLGSAAFAINDRGDIAGYVLVDALHAHAALWRHGRLVDLGTLGGTFAAAVGVNGRGEVIGHSSVAGGDTQHGFWWHDGVLRKLPAEGGSAIVADINDRGEVVGSLLTRDGHGNGAAIWRRGRLVKLVPPLGDPATATATEVNNNGEVLGGVEVAGSGQHVFLLTRAGYADLGVGDPVDLNERGEAVVIDVGLPPAIAARWLRGTRTELPTLGRPDTAASDINNRGQIVGGVPAPEPPYDNRAVLWTARNKVVDLGPLEGRATMINDHGRTVGYVNVPDQGVRAVAKDLAGEQGTWISVRPRAVHPGQRILVSGVLPTSGPWSCPAADQAILTSTAALFPPEGRGPAIQRGSRGSFLVPYRVPSSAPPGTYRIGMRCSGGTIGISAAVRIV